MIKRGFILLSLLLAFWSNVAQGQPVANAVKQAALKYATRPAVAVLERDKNFRDPAIDKAIEGSLYFDYDAEKAGKLIREYPEFLSLEIAVNDQETYILDLISAAKSFNHTTVTGEDGRKISLKNFKAAFYRGVVRGLESQTLVSVSLFENELGAVIFGNHGNLVIGKIKGTDKHILYNDKVLNYDLYPSCGVPDPPLKDHERDLYDKSQKSTFSGTMIDKCVDLYFETEYDIFLALGSIEGVITWVTNLYNNVAVLYANEMIQTTLSDIYPWYVVDPYNASTAEATLTEFQDERDNINGHLGMLLTKRDIGGGWAMIDGLCYSVDERLGVSGNLELVYPGVPTYSWTTQVVTHEFGHIFGSRHTHACVWNGNNTAIDGCAGETEGSCPLPDNPGPEGGTIMSYCHQISGVGINFMNGFGEQPGNLIRSRVIDADCVPSCCSPNQIPDFTITETCTNGNRAVTATPGDQSPPNHWWGLFETNVPGATSGGVLVGNVQSGSTANFQGLDDGKFYYILHRIWDIDCYEEKEYSVALTGFASSAVLSYTLEDINGYTRNQFCFGENIYLDGTASSNYDRFFMSVWRRPIGGGNFTYYANYGWTISNNIGTLNLSQLFLNNGEDPGEIFEPGYEYELQFAIANPPQCVPWIDLVKRFTVTCCTDFISADFRYELNEGSTGLEVTVFGFNAYEPYATHEWTVMSSPNANGGPYTLVNETTTTGNGPVVLYGNGDYDLYYFVVHKVTTLCGEVCFIQRKIAHDGTAPDGGIPCDICGRNDCSILDNICFAPQNLHITCNPSLGLIALWDAVPGAGTYQVQVKFNDPNCCSANMHPITYTYYTNNPSFVLGASERSCFSYRVATVCESGPAWSAYECFTGCVDGLNRPNETELTIQTAPLPTPELKVYPNPANSELNIVLGKNVAVGLIRMTDMYGRSVFEQQIVNDQHLKIDTEAFPAGIYNIRIICPDNRQSVKKVVVSH